MLLFAATPAAAEEVPLDQPGMENAAVLAWAASAAANAMTFTHLDYQKEMQKSSKNFTKTGWEGFTTALQKSHLLDSVQVGEQSVTATPPENPVLVQKGGFNGRYRWIMQMPMLIKYQGVKESRIDKLSLTLVVERTPATTENPVGLGIAQWIARKQD